MKNLNRNILLLVVLMTSILMLSGCKSKEPKRPDNFGIQELPVTESSSVSGKEIEVETTDAFAITDNVDLSGEQESVKEEFNPFAPVDRTGFTDEEISELEEIDANTYTDPITGEQRLVSDTINIANMQEEARDVWKESYKSGEVSKEDVEFYFNTMYEEIDESEQNFLNHR